MVTNEQEHKIKEIFVYAKNINREQESMQYVDLIDTFLAIASFVLDNTTLYPHWISDINVNSIFKICFLLNYDRDKKNYVREILHFFQDWKEEIWIFIDSQYLAAKMTVLDIFFRQIRRIK